MKLLRIIRIGFGLAFYRWAMREINRLHPDVPKVTHRLHHYESQWAAFMGGRSA